MNTRTKRLRPLQNDKKVAMFAAFGSMAIILPEA